MQRPARRRPPASRSPRSRARGRTRAAPPAPPAARWSAPPGRASPTARPRARRPGSRWGCWAARPPRRRARRGCRRAARRSRGSSSRRRPPPALQAPRRGASPPPRSPRPRTAQAVSVGRGGGRGARCARPPARACRPRRSATPRPSGSNSATACPGSSVCTCTRSVRSSPTTSTESPSCLEQRREVARVEVLAGDREVRAVAEARGLVLGPVQRGRRVLVLELGRGVAAQRGQAAGDDHRQPVGAGVDHARLAQDRELLGPALDGLLGRLERVARAPRPAARPAPAGWRPGRAGACPCARGRAPPGWPSPAPRRASSPRRGRAPTRRRRRPRARRRRTRGSGRPARPGARPAPRPRRARSGRGSRRSCRARRAAPRAPRRSRSRRARSRRSPGRSSSVELVEHGLQGERHVVPGVAVGDREHVQVVDLLAAAPPARRAPWPRPVGSGPGSRRDPASSA